MLSLTVLGHWLILTFNYFVRHPIRKVLVSINHSPYLTYLCHNVFDREKETNKKRNETTFADIDLLYISPFILKQDFLKHGFIREGKPLENFVIIEEELNRFDIDDIENLEHLSRFVFMCSCGNLKVVNDDEELTRNINQKKKLDVSQIAC